MTMKGYSVRLPETVMPRINQFAAEAGVSQSAAIRMLIQRSLGVGLPRLLVDEKVHQVNLLINARVRDVLVSLRSDLHAAIDSGFSTPPPESEFEPVSEPELAPMTGRRQPAKARRR